MYAAINLFPIAAIRAVMIYGKIVFGWVGLLRLVRCLARASGQMDVIPYTIYGIKGTKFEPPGHTHRGHGIAKALHPRAGGTLGFNLTHWLPGRTQLFSRQDCFLVGTIYGTILLFFFQYATVSIKLSGITSPPGLAR